MVFYNTDKKQYFTIENHFQGKQSQLIKFRLRDMLCRLSHNRQMEVCEVRCCADLNRKIYHVTEEGEQLIRTEVISMALKNPEVEYFINGVRQ